MQHPDRLGGRQILIVAVVMLGLIIDGLDIQLLALVSPVIIVAWGTTKAAFGAAMGAALIGMALGASSGGWLGDRWGRKTVLVGATLLFGCATAAASLTGNVAELAVLRLVTGLGFGAAAPNGMALASEWLPPRARPVVVTILSATTPFGGVVGAGAILFLLPALGWKGCFILCGLASLVISAIMALVLAESPAFVPRSQRRAEPLPSDTSAADKAGDKIFSRERLRFNAGAWTQFFCINFIAYSMAAWTPVMLTAKGYSIAFALRAVFANSLAAVAGALLVSVFLARTGSRAPLFVCLAIALGALVALAVILGGPAVQEGGAAAFAILGLAAMVGGFIGAAIGVTYALLAHVYPTSARARGIGTGIMMGRFGGVVSTLIGGVLLSLRKADPTPYLVVLASCALIGILAMLVVDRHIPKAA